MVLDDSVERLLDERIHMARSVGVLLEHRIRSDLDRIGRELAPALTESPDAERLRALLAHQYRASVLAEGAFVLDADGHKITEVPVDTEGLSRLAALPLLVRRADSGNRPVVSELIRLPVGDKPVLVLLAPISAVDGQRLGYVGGLYQPAATSVLDAFASASRGTLTDIEIVDGDGVVVASTDSAKLYEPGDHGSVLTRAIAERRHVQSRCHSCHTESGAPNSGWRTLEVLAFVPMPTLELGLAVRQPEAEALAPAFALRRRMLVLSLAFVALFVLFAGLSVRSVVDPVVRLTRAVARREAGESNVPLPRLGGDEVGVLGATLERWRAEVLGSLEVVEQHRQALHQEMDSTRRHLQALEDIALMNTLRADLATILENGLDWALRLQGLAVGIVLVKESTGDHVAIRGIDKGSAERLLAACTEELEHEGAAAATGAHRFRVLDLPCGKGVARGLRTLIVADLLAPQGLCITCVLADPETVASVEERWLQSLLHHLGMSASNRILRDREQWRKEEQEQLLHRILRAQEGERRRVAREIHDTVSQDLAALRLDLERLACRDSPPPPSELHRVEGRTGEVLETVRAILLDLRLSVLENMGFLPALQWYLERLQRDHGIRGTLTVDGDEGELDYETAVTIFRIFQESLQNVILHANADHIFVTVGFSDRTIELTVEDDGTGFDLEAMRARIPGTEARCLGILGMEERARLLGGTLEVITRPGEATTVQVVVPRARDGMVPAARLQARS